mmetsp:Transcript_3464/g.7184  ORF Transcript_3464/g.7184 Transcript_3464/m.7184 type:complete len:135 (-) Transcript_3464:1321-1725(-)
MCAKVTAGTSTFIPSVVSPHRTARPMVHSIRVTHNMSRQPVRNREKQTGRQNCFVKIMEISIAIDFASLLLSFPQPLREPPPPRHYTGRQIFTSVFSQMMRPGFLVQIQRNRDSPRGLFFHASTDRDKDGAGNS